MGSDANRKLRSAARSCARSSRSSDSSYCADAKATLCIYRRMGWIGSSGSTFQKSNVDKIGLDMLDVPAFKVVSGGSAKQVIKLILTQSGALKGYIG